jgi:hypothetical protein
MTYQENHEEKYKRHSSSQAISLAMEGRWKEAVEVNKSLIKRTPNDADAYNRLGKAYMEIGQYKEAREAYEKALALDRYSTIAQKNLQRLDQLDEIGDQPEEIKEKASPKLFVEEIGKAGVVSLYQVAPKNVLVKVSAGDRVNLRTQDSVLRIETMSGEYLGLVPAKYSQRLIKLMSGGNNYAAAVVSTSDDNINVIIRETYQDPSQLGKVSFPGRRLEEIQPYGGDRLFKSEMEEEIEPAAFEEESAESTEEIIEDIDESKEWGQEE